MARNANIGTIEIGEDGLIHPGYPHLVLTLPLAGGAAIQEGTVLQMIAGGSLVAGDFTKRSYIALEDIADDAEEALVLSHGAARTEKLVKSVTVTQNEVPVTTVTPLTAAEAVSLMEKSPLACI
jgi:hypothetical protein